MNLKSLFGVIGLVVCSTSLGQNSPFLGNASDQALEEELARAVPSPYTLTPLNVDPILARESAYLRRLKHDLERNLNRVMATIALDPLEIESLNEILREIVEKDEQLASENLQRLCQSWNSSSKSEDEAIKILGDYKQGEIDIYTSNELRINFVDAISSNVSKIAASDIFNHMNNSSRNSELSVYSWADRVIAQNSDNLPWALDQTCGGI